ncbi:MAG TPA: RNA polymerase sigma factor [Candidatus Eisenbacteria bacterium]|nr:RNA polymerase sigma factor [Candidatus Eisenbacteria bacterium]
MNPAGAIPPSNPGVKTQHEAEALLLERCRKGDTLAFRALVEAHQDRAYALALRIVRTSQDAEEVAQDAFVRAWRSIGEFRGDAAFGTWLHRIVVRRALDRAETLRARSAREVERDDDSPDRLDSQGSAHGSEAASSPLSRRLARLLASLPPVQRAALSLHYYEDRSVSEIAALLEMPEGTVKTHMSRARAALRQAWAREARTGLEGVDR